MDNNYITVPCQEEVEKYFNISNSLAIYVAQESSLDKLFFRDFKYNENL